MILHVLDYSCVPHFTDTKIEEVDFAVVLVYRIELRYTSGVLMDDHYPMTVLSKRVGSRI